MNYRHIISSRKTREKILRVLSFIPDKLMLKIQYRVQTGRRLDLKNPRRYTEKLQWYKLYYHDPLMIQCTDKYDVREYVKARGFEYILNECYGVYESVDDIDYDNLPDKFVFKDTLGSGGNSVVICKDKSHFIFETAKRQMGEWLHVNRHIRFGGREWPYYKGKDSRIIVDRYIESDLNEVGLTDWKFICFNGKAHYLYVINGRKMGESVFLGIFDMQFRQLPCFRTDERQMILSPQKPLRFEEMINISEALAKDFPHVRVDLYNIHGKIIFGELSFFDGSGYQSFEPDEFDYQLGSCFVLPLANRYPKEDNPN